MTILRHKTHSCTSLNELLAPLKFFRIIFTWVAPSSCDDTINTLFYFLRHSFDVRPKTKTKGVMELSRVWLELQFLHQTEKNDNSITKSFVRLEICKVEKVSFMGCPFFQLQKQMHVEYLAMCCSSEGGWIFFNSGDLSVVFCSRLRKDVTGWRHGNAVNRGAICSSVRSEVP